MGCSLHYCPAPQCWVACMWFRSSWLLCCWGITAVSFSLSCLCGRNSHWNDSLRSVTHSCQVCLSAYWWYQEASSICLTISPLSLINLVEAFLKFDGLGFFLLLFGRLAFWLANFSLFRKLVQRVLWKTALNSEGVYGGWIYFVSSCKESAWSCIWSFCLLLTVTTTEIVMK